MPEKFRKIIILFMLIAALSVPVAYTIGNGRSLYALSGAFGLLVLSFIIRTGAGIKFNNSLESGII